MPAPSNNTSGRVGGKRNAIELEKAIIQTEYQVPHRKVAVTQWCDAGDTDTHRAPAPSNNISALQPLEAKNPDANDDEAG